MSLYLRLFWTLLALTWRKPITFLETSAINLRVWPNDLDINLHVNNGRFLTLADLGVMTLSGRMGVFRAAVRKGWRPVVGAAVARYRRPLKPFQKYRLETRILGWNEKWTFFQSRFIAKGEVMATVVTKGMFLGREGRVSPLQVAALTGRTGESPALPEWVAHWDAAEAAFADAEQQRPLKSPMAAQVKGAPDSTPLRNALKARG